MLGTKYGEPVDNRRVSRYQKPMWRKLLLIAFAPFGLIFQAHACSCGPCPEFSVSEFLNGNQAFFGVPLESRFEEGDSQSIGDTVMTRIRVLEAYGQMEKGSEITVYSAVPDGASCGIDLNVGVLEFIVVNNHANFMSSCICSPPTLALIKYLKDGEDVKVPPLIDCVDEDNNDDAYEIKSKKTCEVWKNFMKQPYATDGEKSRVLRAWRDSRKPKVGN